ncbi:MAG TPA: putative sulfate exporter family transporter, partial [Bacteroidetes bacterium]|nr:putative sulfate exporter family transporter [Bacteroidota bacterium]
ALVSAWVFRKSTGKTTIPWFIVMFVLVVGLNDYIPFAHVVEGLARKGMIVALFVIGAGSTRKGLTSVGTKPFVLGLILWLLVGTATAVVILAR